MDKIKDELTALNINIPHNELDRCHRVGPKYFKDGKSNQAVLLKFGFWRTRNLFYQNRSKFNFKVEADLTTRRKALLEYAKGEVKNGNLETTRVVDFVLCDLNCKLKVKSKSNKFYAFNSEQEFLTIISRLDIEHCASEEMIEDELNNELYY